MHSQSLNIALPSTADNALPAKPATFFVIKRDGSLVSFSPDKITLAISKAVNAADPGVNNTQANKVAFEIGQDITERLSARLPDAAKINIEDIQDPQTSG